MQTEPFAQWRDGTCGQAIHCAGGGLGLAARAEWPVANPAMRIADAIGVVKGCIVMVFFLFHYCHVLFFGSIFSFRPALRFSVGISSQYPRMVLDFGSNFAASTVAPGSRDEPHILEVSSSILALNGIAGNRIALIDINLFTHK